MKVKPNKYDRKFSDWVRERDGWTCQRCGGEYMPPTRALHCSHYWKRGKHATRFEPDNSISLCMGCHLLMEGDKQGEYKDLMIKKLGYKRFKKLEKLSKTVVKKRNAEAEAWAWLIEA